METLNRASFGERLGERLKLSKRGEPKIVAPEGGWQIRILEDTDEEAAPGRYRDFVGTGAAGQGRDRVGVDDEADRDAANGRGGIDQTELRCVCQGGGSARRRQGAARGR